MVETNSGNVVGVVLAGGASRRMGRDKALVDVAGRPMLDWVADAVGAVTTQIVVAGERRPRWADRLRFIEDHGAPRRGPLAGLVAVMERVEAHSLLLVVGVDQPWVRPSLIGEIAARFTGLPVVPVPDGIRQTTCAAYPANDLLVATRELNAGGSIQSMLDRTAFDPFTEADLESCGEDGRSWFSVNTPDDVAEGLDRYGPPSSE
ncbi:MAG: molybdenum cofactor guanylyltransferase [Acidimicrobiia bacterium]|nr:molybdenum cofactor guanylyltransferase [Acidimicrobiia bacterium]